MTETTLILGSSSPRRAEILRFFSLPFEQISPSFTEESVCFKGNPSDYVQEIALGKAKSLAKERPSSLLITADTSVFCEGKVYNKPQSYEEAFSFLQDLSGKWHSVHTAVCIAKEGRFQWGTEETRILFHPLSKEQIKHYLSHINFLDKAGAYAIQQSGAIIVKKIEGCYYNVMGLPLTLLQTLLLEEKVDLWQHLKIL
jgi:septum formation protein